ncbi:Arc family DNA-binding protein [Acinetobacter thermotolerans]|uniref:Arc family DNA-binding protein n=1 Tax=Acinetobacter thermotolerans TaxID=3151487 RepID=UPI00325AF77E
MSEDQSGVVTLKVRVSPEFRERIVKSAKANNRSMNQEIVSRLEKSFEGDKPEEQYVDISKALGMIFDEIQDLKKNQKKV